MNKSDKQQITSADKVVKQIDKLYRNIITQVASLTDGITFDDPISAFYFANFPKIKKQVDELLNGHSDKIIRIIEQATEQEWLASIEKNNGIITPYLKRKLLTQEQITAYTSKNLDALKAFQQRKTDGLSLSDRVWKYTNQFKTELEMSLDLGIGEGKSAQQISRDIRKYLNEPNLLFRRVRDKHGNLHLSKQAQKMQVGQGVYRSSYKNATRVARTEVNMAYRASDLEKYRQLDFVVGYEVKRSNHLYGCPVCEALQGKYPKDFHFIGWHPQCRCYTIPILNKVGDFIEQQKAILGGREYTPSAQIQDVPDNFKQWAIDNQERMQNAQSVPYWWKNNQQYVEKIIKAEVKNYDVLYKNEVFKNNFDNVKHLTKEFPDIDIERLNAINLYTGSYHHDINRYLRGLPYTIDQKQGFTDDFYKKITQVINGGLEQLPKFEGDVYRATNLPMEVIEQYKKDFINKGTIVEKAFFSTDIQHNIFENSHYSGNVIFHILSKNGRIIEKVSKFHLTEKEVLFRTNTKFKITNFAQSKDIFLITLQEL